ncbi:MAG: hypothetical protein C3F13_14270 [Anaerolineales bacterium]|nr:MAG: hypothetical protein C3F13_14270 [Anaerolineales bacterium]
MNGDGKIIWCAGCGIEISWGATIKEGRAYCCEDCSQGIPCLCAESQELDLEMRGKHGLAGENVGSTG